MTMLGDEDIGSGTLRFAKDYVGADYHNASHSHIDALCHVVFDGALYNGKPLAALTPEGATADAIGVLRDGLVGRGRAARRAPDCAGCRGSSPASTSFPTSSRAASASRE